LLNYRLAIYLRHKPRSLGLEDPRTLDYYTRPYTPSSKEARPYMAIWYRRGRPKGSKNKPNIYIILNNGKDMAYIEAFVI
jgi:hypothetical protein